MNNKLGNLSDEIKDNILDYSAYEKFDKDQLIEAQAKTWNACQVMTKCLSHEYERLASMLIKQSMKGEGLLYDDTLAVIDEIHRERVRINLIKEEYFKITRLIHKRRNPNV